VVYHLRLVFPAATPAEFEKTVARLLG
jgi:hypothetical protein